MVKIKTKNDSILIKVRKFMKNDVWSQNVSWVQAFSHSSKRAFLELWVRETQKSRDRDENKALEERLWFFFWLPSYSPNSCTISLVSITFGFFLFSSEIRISHLFEQKIKINIILPFWDQNHRQRFSFVEKLRQEFSESSKFVV